MTDRKLIDRKTITINAIYFLKMGTRRNFRSRSKGGGALSRRINEDQTIKKSCQNFCDET